MKLIATLLLLEMLEDDDDGVPLGGGGGGFVNRPLLQEACPAGSKLFKCFGVLKEPAANTRGLGFELTASKSCIWCLMFLQE